MPKLAARAGATPAPDRRRKAYFDGRWMEALVLDRASLPAGFRAEGPAIVEEFGSTTVVWPAQSLEIDPHGIILVREKATDTGGRK